MKRSLSALGFAAALCVPYAMAADDPQVTQLQVELRITREQLAAANQQIAASIAAATIQLQALQKQLDAAKPSPAAPAAVEPAKK